MIERKDIIQKSDYEAVSQEIRDNVDEFLPRLQEFEMRCEIDFRLTSGFRSRKTQAEIYEKKNRIRVKKGLLPISTPWGSMHLRGLAVDIYDPDQELQKWCLAHDEDLEELGLYFEDFGYTPDWVHCQGGAPASGKRYFKPY